MGVNFTPDTFAPLEVPTATKLNTNIRDPWAGLLAAWDAYTPVMTGWTLVNGTLEGYFWQVGKTVTGRIEYLVGSSDTKSGTPKFSLPTGADNNMFGVSVLPALGTAALFDVTAGARKYQFTSLEGSNRVRSFDIDGASVTPTVPWTWAVGDVMQLQFTYEAA